MIKCIIMNYEFIDIISSFLGHVVTIVIFWLGVKKVGSLYEDYMKRKHVAIYNFYTQFFSLLTGLECLISTACNEPANVLYQIWGNKESRNLYPSSDIEKKRLGEEIEYFLHYLYNAPEQIPPEITDQAKYNEWISKKRELIIALNKLLAETDVANDNREGPYNEKSIKEYYQQLIGLVHYFQHLITQENSSFQDKVSVDAQKTNKQIP